MAVDPSELPLFESVPRCLNCDYHDQPWPGDDPFTDFIVAGSSFIYEGAGEVKGPHFCRRCRYCGFQWPEGVVPA